MRGMSCSRTKRWLITLTSAPLSKWNSVDTRSFLGSPRTTCPLYIREGVDTTPFIALADVESSTRVCLFPALGLRTPGSRPLIRLGRYWHLALALSLGEDT